MDSWNTKTRITKSIFAPTVSHIVFSIFSIQENSRITLKQLYDHQVCFDYVILLGKVSSLDRDSQTSLSPPRAFKEATYSEPLFGLRAKTTVRNLCLTWRHREVTHLYTEANFYSIAGELKVSLHQLVTSYCGQLQSRRESSLSQGLGDQNPDCAWRWVWLSLASTAQPPALAQALSSQWRDIPGPRG